MKKTALHRCIAKEVGTDRKLNFSPNIQLGTIWQQPTTKMAVARLCMLQTYSKYIILLILSYKVMKKRALLCCTANQVGTGHKLHFQSKHPARTELAAINNKKGCGMAEV